METVARFTKDNKIIGGFLKHIYQKILNSDRCFNAIFADQLVDNFIPIYSSPQYRNDTPTGDRHLLERADCLQRCRFTTRRYL